MVPYSIECWIENMTRKYNYKKKMFETHPGINVYTKDFGTYILNLEQNLLK